MPETRQPSQSADLIKLPDQEGYMPKSPEEAGRLSAERLLEYLYRAEERGSPVQNVGTSEETILEAFRQAVEDGWVENTDDAEFKEAFNARIELGYPAWKN